MAQADVAGTIVEKGENDIARQNRLTISWKREIMLTVYTVSIVFICRQK